MLVLTIFNLTQMTYFNFMCEHLQIWTNGHRVDNGNNYQVTGHFLKPY
jgi:hypothetical protein